jgi:hypothetical protein
MTEAAVIRAREELVFQDLVAYQFPLYQVLALPRREVRVATSAPTAIGDIMRQLSVRPDEKVLPRYDRRGFDR